MTNSSVAPAPMTRTDAVAQSTNALVLHAAEMHANGTITDAQFADVLATLGVVR